MQVREIMKREFRSIARDATVRDAARLMSETGIGMLPVEDRKEIVGTATDRDITIRATANGADPNTTPVSEVMSNNESRRTAVLSPRDWPEAVDRD